jgi:hypothetical protein
MNGIGLGPLLGGDFSDEQRQRLAEIVSRCPIRRTLTDSVPITTTKSERPERTGKDAATASPHEDPPRDHQILSSGCTEIVSSSAFAVLRRTLTLLRCAP